MNWIQVKTKDGYECTISIDKILYVCRETIHLDNASGAWVITTHTHDEIMDAIKRANLGTRIAVV